MTALEMDDGDVLEFQLRNGQTRTLALERTEARIIETVPNAPGTGATPAGILYQFTCTMRIDGQVVDLVRYVSCQQAFYEPYVINGVRIWPDTVAKVFDLIPIRPSKAGNLGNLQCMPRKAARFAIQDASLRICPEELHAWTDDPKDFIDVARCYNGGDDTYLGAYRGRACHIGLDINQPKGSPLFAPLDLDAQGWFNSLEMGHNNNRWRAVRRWDNGDVWALQSSHLIELLVPENTPLKKGTKYATSAGVHVGAHEHTHFEFKTGRPRAGKQIDPEKISLTHPIDFGDESELAQEQPEVLHLDPWILFRQIFEDVKDRQGTIRADMRPPSPAKTGEAASFFADGSRPPRGQSDIRYYWTFGDGGWATQANPVYRYARPGIYPVTLVVVSGTERATRTMHLTVSGDPIITPALAITADDPSFRLRPAQVADVYGWPVHLISHTLKIHARAGGPIPQIDAVQLVNLGGGTLGATAATVDYESGDAWLSVAKSAANDEQSLSLALAVEAAGLEPGMYLATVTVSCDGAMNSPQSFRVELTVSSDPPSTRQTIDDRDSEFYATPYFWVGHRFTRTHPSRRGHDGFYLSNGGRPDAGEFVRFTPRLATGRYKVQLSAKSPFAADSQFTARVRHAEGQQMIRVVPQMIRVVPRESRMLGTFVFHEERPAFVEFTAANSAGTVIADAIEFFPAEEQ